MQVHANAKLGPAGRVALVELVLSGLSLRAAAAALNVAPATAHRWWHRYLEADVALANKATADWARDRSSRPRRCPRQLTAREEAPILAARERTNWGPARIAGLVRRARSTVWKVLWRHGLSRRRSEHRRQTYRRYEWSQPGALLHMDTKRLQRFAVPGHWATGDRSEHHKTRHAGYSYAHVVIDDHTRLAYVELHGADSGELAARTLTRAIAWFAEQGAGPVQAVMTDNALTYTRSNAFQAAIGHAGAKHIRIPPRTPRWNGKAERFIQTLDREWAKARTWPNHHARDRALRSFLRYYNRARPHSSLNDRPPISRVHNLRGQDS
jgi:transposase InsO family protein